MSSFSVVLLETLERKQKGTIFSQPVSEDSKFLEFNNEIVSTYLLQNPSIPKKAPLNHH